MTEQEHSRRKSFFESLPSYLAGFAAVATATVAVLTYLHHQDQDVEANPTTEPEIKGGHVSAVPSVEVKAKGASATGASNSAARAAPTLGSALHPVRCAAYVGTWQLSSGELLTFLEDERVETRANAGAAPGFGRYNCSGRNEELVYLTMEGANSTLVFTLSGDGKLYQRADQRTTTPLTATRTAER
jgi:hypothetical protein